MPQFEVELSDGSTLVLEADRQPTEDEVASFVNQQREAPQTSAAGAFGRAAATGIAPSAAFAAGFSTVAPPATLMAAETGPAAPFIGGAAGLAAGTGAAALAAFGQRKLLEKFFPKFTAELQSNQAADIQQHPVASLAGEVASGLPTFKVAPPTLAQIPFRLGGGAVIGATLPMIFEQRKPTLRDAAAGAAFAAIYGEPRFGKGSANASQISKAAEVHGDVRSQSQQGQGEMPLQEGGPGVQPQAAQALPKLSVVEKLQKQLDSYKETLADAELPDEKEILKKRIEETQKAIDRVQAPALLNEQELSYIDKEREAIDKPIDVVSDEPSPDQPFAKRGPGQFMGINREKGTIEVYPQQFKEWLADLPPERRDAAVASRLWEERFHLATDHAAAKTYWSTLTAAEKAIERRAYTGTWDTDVQAKYGLDDTLWGHEALRRRMQQLAHMDASEIAETAGRERWTLKGLAVLETAIRGMRETIGTKAAAEGKQVLDTITQNLGVARAAIAGQKEPGAQRRNQDFIGDSERPEIGYSAWEDGIKYTRTKDGWVVEGAKDVPTKSEGQLGLVLDTEKQLISDPNEVDAMDRRISISKLNHEFESGTGPAAAGWSFARELEKFIRKRPDLVKMINEDEVSQKSFKPRDLIRPRRPISREPSLSRKFDLGIPQWVRQEVTDVIADLTHGSRPRYASESYGKLYDYFKHAGPEAKTLSILWKDHQNRYSPIHESVTEEIAIRDARDFAIGKLTEAFGDSDRAREVVNGWNTSSSERDMLYEERPVLAAFMDEHLSKSAVDEHGEFITPREPAAQRRKQKFVQEEGGKQELLFGKGATGTFKGAEVPPEQRAVEAPKTEGLAPVKMPSLEDLPVVAKNTIESHKPNFQTLKRWADKALGQRVSPQALQDMWMDRVYSHIIDAPGKRLEELRTAFQMEKKYGSRAVPDPMTAEQRDAMLGAGQKGPTTPAMRVGRKAQAYRQKIINALSERILKQAIPDETVLDRKNITAEDIDWSNPNAAERAWREIHPTMLNPGDLFKLFSDEARRSKEDPVSHTKRVAVLLNKQTGEVAMVSAYPHGRSGIMVSEPSGATGIKGKNNRPLESILYRWRPIYSALLKEPVKDFRKSFKTIADFNEYLGTDANEAASHAQGYGVEQFTGEPSGQPDWSDVPHGTMFDFESEGTPGIREGGIVVGPNAAEGRAQLGIGRGEMLKTRPMSAREAMAVMDFATDEAKVGEIKTRQDMAQVISKLNEMATNKTLKAKDWNAIVAIRKAAKAIQRTNPDFTPTQAYSEAVEQFYDLIQNTESQTDYITQALGRFNRPTQEVGGGTTPGIPSTPGRVEGVSRELTMRERLPPTVTRGEIPSGTAPDVPEGTPGDFGPPRQLNAAEAEAVRNQIALENAQKKEAERYGGPRPSIEPFKAPTAKAKGVVRYGKLPFVETPEGRVLAQGPQRIEPGAQRRQKTSLEEEFSRLKSQISTWAGRRTATADIYRTMDGVERNAEATGLQKANNIRLASLEAGPRKFFDVKARELEARKVRGAVKAVIAASFEPKDRPGVNVVNPEMFDKFIEMSKLGAAKAQRWMADPNPVKRWVGGRWYRSQLEHIKELEYAKAHYKDPIVKAAEAATRKELKDHLDWMNANGLDVKERKNMIPGRYDGEVWADGKILWGDMRIIGQNFRKPRTFNNYYEAGMNRPYIPASRDVADLVQSTIAAGRRMVGRNSWMQSLKGMRDESGKPLAMDPIPRFKDVEVKDPKTGEVALEKTVEYDPPSPEYEVVKLGERGTSVAVRLGFGDAVRVASMDRSAIRLPFFGNLSLKPALIVSSMLKHGVVLILDTFHPGRLLLQYAPSLGGKRWFDVSLPRPASGWSALTWEKDALPKAVERGLISPEAMKWATEPIKIWDSQWKHTDTGWKKVPEQRTTTRHQLAQDLIFSGLNATRITDALYRDAVQKIPFIGETWHKMLNPINRWTFDKITPGLIVEGAVRNFERMNAAHPDIPHSKLIRDVVTDINTYYGNMGRQGVFKNPVFRDLAQIFLLAPQWIEGLIGKETRFLGRVTGISNLTGRTGLPQMGTLGRGVARGLLAYFVLAQTVNLITRGKLTFQNDEEGHKLDGWLPTGDGKTGLWLSPMSVFAEVMHDILRLTETKPKMWDAIQQVGSNKLGPVGRMMKILATGETSTGQKITSTPRVLGAAASELSPAPISVAPWARAAGNLIAPEKVAPNKPGELMQRSLASFVGIKTQRSEAFEQQIGRKAQRFLKDNDLAPSTGWQEVQTDEPSYTKLRGALRNDDTGTAHTMLTELRKHHPDADIVKAMKLWSARPFTGAQKYEKLFLNSLDDKELELYSEAMFSRQELYSKFIDFMMQAP